MESRGVSKAEVINRLREDCFPFPGEMRKIVFERYRLCAGCSPVRVGKARCERDGLEPVSFSPEKMGIVYASVTPDLRNEKTYSKNSECLVHTEVTLT